MKLYHRLSIILHLKIFDGPHVYMYMYMNMSISGVSVCVSLLVHPVFLSVDLPPALAGIYKHDSDLLLVKVRHNDY